jgi:nicotinate-nucleotide adenylyltransferase
VRIGIFGGAFDPLHNEHLAIAGAAFSELALDKIIIVPTYRPPHKESSAASYSDRVAMCKAVFANDPRVEVSTIEKDSGAEVNFSYLTVAGIVKRAPAAQYYFIIGGDSLANFKYWTYPEKIARMTALAVASREGFSNISEALAEAERELSARITLLAYKGKATSSSAIRAAAALGEPIPDVPKAVAKYIKDNGLYRKYDKIVSKAAGSVPAELWRHMVDTTLYGVGLRSRLRLPYEKVFLACLLHDIAKDKAKRDPLAHQLFGAELAQSEYGITDPDILNAIRYHTTGRAAMSRLEQLVYFADKYPRYNKGAPPTDFDAAFRDCVRDSCQRVKDKGLPLDKHGEECYNYYITGGNT